MNYLRSLLFCGLFLLISCDQSMLSDKELNDLSNMQVNIHLDEDLDNEEEKDIYVYLTDGKKQIINDKIIIKVNDLPLELSVRQELYYTKKSCYILPDFPTSESYYFEIILPDSTVYPLAYLKPKLKNKTFEFQVPKIASRHNDVVLQWKNLSIPSEMTVSKNVESKTSAEESGGMDSDQTIVENIKTKTGTFLIPRKFLEDEVNKTNYAEIALNHRESGLINPKLKVNSTIFYDSKIERTIEIVE
ncbi:hypothetical protein ACFSX9_15860 [Flavobacterium ardleyense]|uniref:Lipoprotein n=1 Tax=Flavobacterium ardleyense TaxID=2038737 RepID=A0ABW5ZDN7_9FLAO